MVSYISRAQGLQHVCGDALEEGFLPDPAHTGAGHIARPADGTRPVEHRVSSWGPRPQTEVQELLLTEWSTS